LGREKERGVAAKPGRLVQKDGVHRRRREEGSHY
jgi:hypothetical protein